MLNGVGGRTIAEAKSRMSYAEAIDWAAYIKQRGALNQGMRIEAGFALLAMMLSRVHGGKAEMADFMPHFDKPEPSSIQDVFNMLKQVHAQNKKAEVDPNG